ncbi:lipopolysaccharide assembly protein LapB [Salinisphaera sp. T31B1]|uniref:lipopolysaccharide assembly protein LapB n=1 Tax=Salinisphaera sp. T31B1 TaxID=727963 RepID=UPI00334001D2
MLDGIGWLSLALLPVAAASGWYVRGRAKGDEKPAPPVNADYLRGISQLVNDDADQAIATFSRLLEIDNDTAETHLALGNLFRRQGEVDRALRMHQNLVARPNLKPLHRNQARYELAQDYLRAGVLDRAENLFRELADQNLFLDRSLSGLIAIYEQERDWEQAISITRRLEQVRGTSLRPVIAQYYCELAEQARGSHSPDVAQKMLKAARQSFRDCARASLIGGLMAEKAGDPQRAMRIYRQVIRQDVDFISEIIEPMRRCYDTLEQPDGYAAFLRELMPLYDGAHPHVAYARHLHRQRQTDEAIAHISRYLQCEPNWIGFYHLLDLTWSQTRRGLSGPMDSLRQSLGQIIERQPTYHCGQCGFSGRYLHWQCPSCRQWNTMVPVRDVRPGQPVSARQGRSAA